MKTLLALISLIWFSLEAAPITPIVCDQVPPLFSLHPSDRFQFGRLWNHIKKLEEKDLLYEMIFKRREEIKSTKLHWKKRLCDQQPNPLAQEVERMLKQGVLIPSQQGSGGAYFLTDSTGTPRYVIKPFDEDLLCLNNWKHFASPYNNQAFRVRAHIPLYRTAQAEALCFAIAKLLNLERLIPTTFLGIFDHPQFYDIGQKLDSADQQRLYSLIGPPDKEKFCSVQQYIPDTKDLYHLIAGWVEENLTEQEILEHIPLEDFEDLILLIWLLYDTDAHAGNLYVQSLGDKFYRLIKFDNGLTFPDKNSFLQNALYFFPHANLPFSERAKNWVKRLPKEEIEALITYYEMDDAKSAFEERVEILQELILRPTCTMREIDVRMRALALPNGVEVALSDQSTGTIQALIDQTSTQTTSQRKVSPRSPRP